MGWHGGAGDRPEPLHWPWSPLRDTAWGGPQAPLHAALVAGPGLISQQAQPTAIQGEPAEQGIHGVPAVLVHSLPQHPSPRGGTMAGQAQQTGLQSASHSWWCLCLLLSHSVPLAPGPAVQLGHPRLAPSRHRCPRALPGPGFSGRVPSSVSSPDGTSTHGAWLCLSGCPKPPLSPDAGRSLPLCHSHLENTLLGRQTVFSFASFPSSHQNPITLEKEGATENRGAPKAKPPSCVLLTVSPPHPQHRRKLTPAQGQSKV